MNDLLQAFLRNLLQPVMLSLLIASEHLLIAFFDNGNWKYALPKSNLEIHTSTAAPSALFLCMRVINSSL